MGRPQYVPLPDKPLAASQGRTTGTKVLEGVPDDIPVLAEFPIRRRIPTMAETKPITTTLEDYLEAIAWLVGDKGVARVRDIAAALTVHKSTVTATLRSLAEKGLVHYSAYEAATLTPEGRKIAEDVIRRHKIVREFFIEVLALDREMADANACRIEHVVDAEVLDRLASFARFIKECPSAKQQCSKQFQAFFRASNATASEAATPEVPAAEDHPACRASQKPRDAGKKPRRRKP